MDAVSREVAQVRSSDPSYPPRLLHLPDAPGVLHCRGALTALEHPCVTIVGSRRATAYGRRVSEELAAAAARAGWTVVSGMALGVDGAAHRGALRAKGLTVAVLAGGPDRASPRAHAALMEEVLVRGAVLSEHPPGIAPRKHHFPRRNRILAALADRVVVVEAARRSGALLTAAMALELGREVWAVPGSIFSPTTRGTHGLLEDGAVPVSSLDAWAASLEDRSPAAAAPNEYGAGAAGGIQLPLGPDLDPIQRRVWETLGKEALDLEALLAALGLPLRTVLPALTALELQGWVSRSPGPVFHRRAA